MVKRLWSAGPEAHGKVCPLVGPHRRQLIGHYPVVCSWAGCSCASSRAWLQTGRGVPFSEWTAGGAATAKRSILTPRGTEIVSPWS